MNPNYTLVANRANHRCEYCRAPEIIFNFSFEVEHIRPVSRQGAETLDNLALAGRSCNLHKGNRISGIDPNTGTEIRLFHPRLDQWENHFQANITFGTIIALTAIGAVTVDCLEMNSQSQIMARQFWISLGLFP
ncbi:LOW QUALITY PROTEIN: Restriction endonuclease [Dulcicalothrix desertica PCC 7102]|nr:LOW QUALITY PROTEIN: Restriction endonuclease [Dulcicalothrix desertica PCC 7102]